jgi:hypothetical protein
MKRWEAAEGQHLPDGQAYVRIRVGRVRQVVETLLWNVMELAMVSPWELELVDALWG